MKTFQEIKKILTENAGKIRGDYKVRRLGIFGSFIRGEQKEDSDVDILVTFEEPISLLKLVNFENYLQDIIGIKVDVIPENNIRPELRDIILNEVSYI